MSAHTTMHRSTRLALLAALAALVAVGGTVLANPSPGTSEQPAPPASSHDADPDDEGGVLDEEDEVLTAEDLAHARGRLEAAGITVDAAAFDALAQAHGLGGAVRLHAWADETGKTVDELVAQRTSGGTGGEPMGWGRMAKDLGVHPGLGSIMGGGHGRDDAPGQQRKADDADE